MVAAGDGGRRRGGGIERPHGHGGDAGGQRRGGHTAEFDAEAVGEALGTALGRELTLEEFESIARIQEGELDAAAKANSKPLCALVAATGMAEIEGLIRAGHTTRLLPVFIAAITAGNRSFLGSPGARGALTAQDRSGKHQRRR